MYLVQDQAGIYDTCLKKEKKKSLQIENNYYTFVFFVLFYFYVYGCFACMYVCAPCVCNARGDQKNTVDPVTGVTDDCELPCGCLHVHTSERHLGPLGVTEPSH